jgi:hypothetical protein
MATTVPHPDPARGSPLSLIAQVSRQYRGSAGIHVKFRKNEYNLLNSIL